VPMLSRPREPRSRWRLIESRPVDIRSGRERPKSRGVTDRLPREKSWTPWLPWRAKEPGLVRRPGE
jgi:hypothetical protein